MAKKVACDGCDADITDLKSNPTARHNLRAEYKQHDGPIVLGQFEVGPFDLCALCISELQRVSDPKRWRRVQS
jgi:hypothetical protein